LCSNLNIAQKTLNKDDFNQLVDYANCRYVKSFIEQNDVGKPYFRDYYGKKVKPGLEKVTLNDFETILDYKQLKELLSNNIPASQLASKINDRKLKFDESPDNESLIKSLMTTGWNTIDLSKTAANLQNELLSKYNWANDRGNIIVSESEVVKSQTIQTSRQVEELQSKIDQLYQQYENLKNDTKIIEYQKSFQNFKMIVFSLLGLLFILIIIVYILFNRRASRNYIIKQVLGSERISEKFALKDNDHLNSLAKSYNLTEKDINTIVSKVLESNLLKKDDIHQKNKQTINEGYGQSKITIKYLKGKSGKIFNIVDNVPDNSFFKIVNESNDIAQFVFSGDEAEAIAKRVFSEDICTIISGSYQDARSVKTNKPGKIKLVVDQWEVIEPVEIKLT
jgi:hypothetical protein